MSFEEWRYNYLRDHTQGISLAGANTIIQRDDMFGLSKKAWDYQQSRINKLEEAVKVLREMGEKYADGFNWISYSGGPANVIENDCEYIYHYGKTKGEKDGTLTIIRHASDEIGGKHARLALKKVDEVLK